MPKLDRKSKNMILLLAIVIVIGITVYIILRSRIAGPELGIDDTLLGPTTGTSIPSSFNEEVFSSDDFKNLKDYDTREFDVKADGRNNPFEPFQIDIE